MFVVFLESKELNWIPVGDTEQNVRLCLEQEL